MRRFVDFRIGRSDGTDGRRLVQILLIPDPHRPAISGRSVSLRYGTVPHKTRAFRNSHAAEAGHARTRGHE